MSKGAEMTPDEMQDAVRKNDEAKRRKIYDLRNKINALVLRALDFNAVSIEEANNAINVARVTLRNNGLDPFDYKVMAASERSTEEILAEYKTAKAGTAPIVRQSTKDSDTELVTRSEYLKQVSLVNQLKAKNEQLKETLSQVKTESRKQVSIKVRLQKQIKKTEPVVVDIVPNEEGLNTPEAYQMAYDLYIIQGLAAEKVAKAMGFFHPDGSPRNGIIDGAFNNRGPNEALLGTIQIREIGEPMDYKEYWKIGFSLVPTHNWKRALRDYFSFPPKKKNPVSLLTQAQIDDLRTRYHSRQFLRAA